MDARINQTTLFYRYCLWSHLFTAQMALLLTRMIRLITYLLPPYARRRCDLLILYLTIFANMIVRPRYVAIWYDWRVWLRSLVDVGVTCMMQLWGVYYLNQLPTEGNVVIWLLINLIVFFILNGLVLITMVFASFPIVSDDLYREPRDEFQKAVINEASGNTLRVVAVILVVMLTLYFFFPSLRINAPLHISILLFFARISYLVILTRLRWQSVIEQNELEQLEQGMSFNTEDLQGSR